LQRACCFLVAATLAATSAFAAPAIIPKALPAEEPASPAIDPAKLAGSAALRVADARNGDVSRKNLARIAEAVHRYCERNRNELPGDILGKDGKALLSWRVRLLPHIGEKALFGKLKLDQPWDSRHNRPLVDKMPSVFASPRVVVKRKGYTVYQAFSGPGALYRDGKARFRIAAIPDGTSNTILVVESSKAVPWTKPADIAYDRDKPMPDFGKAYNRKPLAALADGSVRVVDLTRTSLETLKNAIDPADGNVLGADW
jgi:hypothetical protein